MENIQLTDYERFLNAIQDGNVEKVEEMLANPNIDPSAHDCDTLGTASKHNQLAILNMLLMDSRIKPSAESFSRAFCSACRYGHLEVVNRLLQDERVDPSARDNMAIRMASDSGYLAVVTRLLQDERVDPSACENHAIIVAHSGGHQAIVDRLRQDPRVGYNVEV